MTPYLVTRYPHRRAFFHLRQLGAGTGLSSTGGGHQQPPLDNPDQRICDDVGAFCRLVLGKIAIFKFEPKQLLSHLDDFAAR